MKTNKSFTKRLKVTKKDKVVARTPGQNHFNAKESGTTRLKRKQTRVVSFAKKVRQRFIP